MPPYPLHRFSEFATLSPTQRAQLAELTRAPRHYPRRAMLRQEGSTAQHVWLLHSGWVGSSIDLPSAKRQLVKIHLPGDVLGSTSMCLASAGDTLLALSDVVATPVPFAVLGDMFTSDPRMAAAFMLSVQKERVTLMHKLAEVGRTSAYERVAGLMLDLLTRGRAAGVVADTTIECPLTQEQMADLLGLTNVHVNRMLRRLNQDGLVEGTHGRYVVTDEAGLAASVPFHPRFAWEPGWLPEPVEA